MVTRSRGGGELPLRVYVDAGITPEQAVLVIESLSRMAGVPLEIAPSTSDASTHPHLTLVPRLPR